MAGKYKHYDRYVESGVPWQGAIPNHWRGLKLKFLFIEKKKNSNPLLPAGSISFGVVVYKNEDNLSEDTKESYREVLKGEFLINPLNLNYDLKSLRTALSDKDVVVSSGYIVVRATHLVDKSFARWLFHQFDVAHMKTLGSGVRQTLTYTDISNCYAFFPQCIDEQRAIGEFINHETAKIDALIEKQEKLIELLKEKRQAVISHAVTKGLNPDVPMKDSGVEWLGEVPENWDVGKIGYFAKVSNGATPSRENLDYWTNGTIPWLNSSKVNDLKIQQADQFITHKAKRETSVAIVKPDDLVVGITGEGQTRGRVAICAIEATINQHLACISVVSLEKVNPLFLYYYLVNSYQRLRDESDGGGATKGAITCVQLHKFPLLSPSLSEQNAICDFLNEALSKLDSLLDEAQHLILLFRERKASLISHAVTGKIDVRNWQSASKEKSHA